MEFITYNEGDPYIPEKKQLFLKYIKIWPIITNPVLHVSFIML